MCIGPRIKLARARAGLTLRELGKRVGVSATAISKFERGEVAPRQSTLLHLAEALSVGIEYFFRDIRIQAVAPAYRKHSRLPARAREAVEATTVEAVERFLTVEQLFPSDSLAVSKLPGYTVQVAEDAESAADKLRAAWHLGSDPIEDLCGRLEGRGIKVIALDGPQGFDGYSCWVNKDIPVIAFNANVPGDRQRFDLCHELGHLVLTVLDSVDAEKAAHRFAGAFLVSAEAARVELGPKRTNLSFDELLLLKQQYGVSIQVWIRRAFDLGIIGQSAYAALFRQLSAKGWRTQEPGEVPPEHPSRLRLLTHRALAENLITPSFAATLLDGSPGTRPQSAELLEPSPDLEKEYLENEELRAFVDADVEDFHDKDC